MQSYQYENEKKPNKANPPRQNLCCSNVETFAGLARLWLKAKAAKVKVSTVEKYARVIEKHVLPNLGDIKLDAIKPDVVENYLNSIAKDLDTSAETSNKALSELGDFERIRVSPSDLDDAGMRCDDVSQKVGEALTSKLRAPVIISFEDDSAIETSHALSKKAGLDSSFPASSKASSPKPHVSNDDDACQTSGDGTSVEGQVDGSARKAKLSSSTVAQITGVVLDICRFGADMGIIDDMRLNVNKVKVKNKVVKPMSPQEQMKLVKFILGQKPSSANMAILLSMATGFRIGEICALRWGDVDLKNGRIEVKRTIQRLKFGALKETTDECLLCPSGKNRKKTLAIPSKTVLTMGNAKTFSSIRSIPMTEDIKKLFKIMKDIAPNEGFVFGHGEYCMEPRTLQLNLKKQCELAGVKSCGFHALRHTFATRCFDNGCDVKGLSEIMGHSEVSITINRYVHSNLEAKRKQLERAWSESGKNGFMEKYFNKLKKR